MILPGISVASDLTVEVVGIRSNKGQVHFGLYNNSKTFLDENGRLDGAKESIKENRSVYIFKGIKPGLYGVAVYHDENKNNEFDQNFFGIPLEDFGFSNGARVFLGAPDFSDAAVYMPPKGLKIIIRID